MNLNIEQVLLQSHLDHILVLDLSAAVLRAHLVYLRLSSDLLLFVVINILDERTWRVRFVVLKQIIGPVPNLVLGRLILVSCLFVLLLNGHVRDVATDNITLLLT